MPTFTASPFAQSYGLQPGIPAYSFGAKSNIVDNSTFYVTNVALTSNVATVSVKLRYGGIPIAKQLLTIVGTTNVSGAFNVTNVPITSVGGFTSGDKSVGTLVFPLTHADVASAPAAGEAQAPPLETGDTITPATPVSGQAFAIAPVDAVGNSKSIAWRVSFPATPPTSSFEADLEGSDSLNGPFSKLDSITDVSGQAKTYEPLSQISFVRVSVVTNDAATSIVATVTV